MKLDIWDLFDPLTSIKMGTFYDAKMRTFTRPFAPIYLENLRFMLCAYNAGPGNVQKYRECPPFKETQHYWRAIFGYWDDYKLHYLP